MAADNQKYIKIRGARENNLKNIDVDIPRNELVVMTGLSGSGKSSLAFDTIYAEGQRRYMESLSSYARQFLGRMEKPKVESIEGLSPAISIDQKAANRNPRSTVGTVTEIHDYLRLLYARCGTVHCPDCGREISRQSVDQMTDAIMALEEGAKIRLLAPVVRGRKGRHEKVLDSARRSGYVRVRIDGSQYELSEDIRLDKNLKHNIDIIVDRLIVKPGIEGRLSDSIDTVMKLSGGLMTVDIVGGKEIHFSDSFSCPDCGISIEEVEPRSFSFNNPFGACPACTGLGYKMEFDPELIKGVNPRYLAFLKEFARPELERYMKVSICEECGGRRLKKSSLAVTVGGKNIHEVSDITIKECRQFFSKLKLENSKAKIAAPILKEVDARLGFLLDVGLEYLTLTRYASSLSGGEAQRIRLATQIGSGLTGVLYILDEPSIGLHQKDNTRLLATLKKLRDLGNTLIVVEHDEETMKAADCIIDIGPGAGIHGGEIVATGTAADIMNCPESITGDYLSGRKKIEVPKTRRKPSGWIEVIGAKENNLKNINVKFPLGVMCAVTGVSGSGKSSLVDEILSKSLAKTLNRSHVVPGKHEGIAGIEALDKVVCIDQSPIGRTPRSNPATYTGVFDLIRDLFAQTKEAKARGFAKGRFSFNVKGGRCEACSGDGIIKIEMHFLPDVYVKCDTCKGHRYNRETLEVKYKGKNIFDVLDMTVEEALEFFKNVPRIQRKLKTLDEVGLSYIKLGQPSTTLSGGEAQRVKLATELSKRATGRTMYILDEPTTGLHFADVHKLVDILRRLSDGGNTVVVIEHNLDVIKTADYIIDMGPDGGDAGGEVFAKGTPEEVALDKRSYTGAFLKSVL